jgi:hypothetical protein
LDDSCDDIADGFDYFDDSDDVDDAVVNNFVPVSFPVPSEERAIANTLNRMSSDATPVM